MANLSFDDNSYKNQVSFDEPQLEFDEESLNIGATQPHNDIEGKNQVYTLAYCSITSIIISFVDSQSVNSNEPII